MSRKRAPRYRKIFMSMHGDEKYRRLSPMPPSGQGLWWQLLAGEQTGIIPGLCKIGEAAFAEQLRWSLKDFRRCWTEIHALKMVRADWDARLVWVPKAVTFNPPDNPNVVRSWSEAWAEMPECALRDEAEGLLRASLARMGAGFVKAFDEVTNVRCNPCANPSTNHSADPSANQEQEQEQEQERVLRTPNPSRSAGKASPPDDRPAEPLPAFGSGGDLSGENWDPSLYHWATETDNERAAELVAYANARWHTQFSVQSKRNGCIGAVRRYPGPEGMALLKAAVDFMPSGKRSLALLVSKPATLESWVEEARQAPAALDADGETDPVILAQRRLNAAQARRSA